MGSCRRWPGRALGALVSCCSGWMIWLGSRGRSVGFRMMLLDKVLAPALGKNSATKIVGVANTLMFNFQLGMGNLAFPVLNAMTFMQTVLPQASFVMSATPGRIARYYSHWPAAGTDGLAHGAVSSINPLKLMGQSYAGDGEA